jgi:hypothetical protein
MWFERFFRIISDKVPPSALLNIAALSELDPDKIYVENVRSILRVSHGVARAICELAVKHGAFRKYTAVQCPDGSQGAEAEFGAPLPPTVLCYEERDGFLAEVEMPTDTLRHTTFYRLANG